MLQQLAIETGPPLSLVTLMVNLIVGVMLSLSLRWHFRVFGTTLSNREEFAQIFPFILLTTILIISIIKSSLALSLGLVGALSIVRFRTPIKEPEELAYLFIAIGMGLGLGANQTLVTVIAGLAILSVMAFLKWARAGQANKNLYLSIDWRGDDDSKPQHYLDNLDDVIKKHVRSSDLRRYDVRNGSVEVSYYLDVPAARDLSALADELREKFPNTGITFLDQNQLPSI